MSSDSNAENIGPSDNAEQPLCHDCGSWQEWVDRTEEIRQLEPAKRPPGPWGHWRCLRCSA
jgi:ribosomal protein L34E